MAPSSDPARPAGPRAAVMAPQAPVGSETMRQVMATRRMLGESWCRRGWLLPSRVSARTAETPRRGQAGDTTRTPAKSTSLTTSPTVMARGGAWPQPPTLETAAPDSPSPGPPPAPTRSSPTDTPATLSPLGPSSSAPAPWSGTVLKPYQMEVGMELSSETRGWGGGDRSWAAIQTPQLSRGRNMAGIETVL